MTTLETMLSQHPQPNDNPRAIFAETLQTLALCQQICRSCADACLGEDSITPLRRCIGLNLDCAALCAATAELVIRQTEGSYSVMHEQLHACALACQACAEECQKHASMHKHCATCAETCRRCQAHCNQLLGEISAAGLVPQIIGE